MPRNIARVHEKQAVQTEEPYYGEYSRLAEQFLRPRGTKPIHSIGQGIAEVLGDVGEAYFLTKAAQKEQAKAEKDNAALAKAFEDAGNTSLGLYPQFAGQSDPMTANQRGRYAMSRLAEENPNLAASAGPTLMDMARQFEPPKPTYMNAEGIGVVKIPGDGGTPTTVIQRPQPQKQNPEEMDVALWVNGGDEAKAQEWLKAVKTPKTPTPTAPSGYRFAADGQSLEAIPGGPAAAQTKTEPPQGYRWSTDGTKLEAIEGGPADIGQRGLPQAYKDQKAALDALEATLDEYDTLVGETGTEYWNTDKARRLESLQTQMMFGVKDVAKTGALDQGTVTVMNGLIPDATSFGANVNVFRGASPAKARSAELRGYVQRARAAADKAYGAPQQAPIPAPGRGTLDQQAMGAIPAPTQRKVGTIYETPSGPMRWTGTGWLPASDVM
jgi:hypothetical protein